VASHDDDVTVATQSVTDKMQRVLNAAARVVSGTRKIDHGLTQLLHADLHWLDVPERIKYKLCMIMRRCQDGTAPHGILWEMSELVTQERIVVGSSNFVEELTTRPAMYDH